MRQRRGSTFDELASFLGLTTSGLRRWARKEEGIKGAYKVKGKWILRGPLSQKRIEDIRKRLKLNPEIAKGRQGTRHSPQKNTRRSSPLEKHTTRVETTKAEIEELNQIVRSGVALTPHQQRKYDNLLNFLTRSDGHLSIQDGTP